MLTVKQINEVSFGKAGFSGYKPDDVDNFIDEVVASFQQLETERDDALKRAQELSAKNTELSTKNEELQEKLGILAQKIESYREDEDGIKDVLLSAQRLAKSSVQDAKDKAEIILQDAQDSARQILDNAKLEASRSAKEYAAQAEEKKEELEEIKRQVSAFRNSLLEMYKKHLEQINHIPNFRQKEKHEEEEPPVLAEEPVEKQEVKEPKQPPVFSVPEPVQAVREEKAAQEVVEPVQQPAEPQPQRRPQAVQRQQPRTTQSTLHDHVNYSKEQMQPIEGESGFADDDLSDVGIDIKAYSDIPESLKREKSSNFSNLEFGDDVDLGRKKRKK